MKIVVEKSGIQSHRNIVATFDGTSVSLSVDKAQAREIVMGLAEFAGLQVGHNDYAPLPGTGKLEVEFGRKRKDFGTPRNFKAGDRVTLDARIGTVLSFAGGSALVQFDKESDEIDSRGYRHSANPMYVRYADLVAYPMGATGPNPRTEETSKKAKFKVGDKVRCDKTTGKVSRTDIGAVANYYDVIRDDNGSLFVATEDRLSLFKDFAIGDCVEITNAIARSFANGKWGTIAAKADENGTATVWVNGTRRSIHEEWLKLTTFQLDDKFEAVVGGEIVGGENGYGNIIYEGNHGLKSVMIFDEATGVDMAYWGKSPLICGSAIVKEEAAFIKPDKVETGWTVDGKPVAEYISDFNARAKASILRVDDERTEGDDALDFFKGSA